MKTFPQILLCFVFLIFLSACASQKSDADSAVNQHKKERIAEFNKSVFGISIVVEGKDTPKKFSVGTGFLIGENLIASALHVQTRGEELAKKFEKPFKIVGWQKLKSGEFVEFPIEIIAEDKENDLMIYKFDNNILKENLSFSAVKPLTLAEKPPSIGEKVVSIGYYGDYKFPFNSIGNVAMIDANEDIFSDLTLMPGNSGAPICSLETGKVVGVTTDVLDLGNETVRYGIAKSAVKLRILMAKR